MARAPRPGPDSALLTESQRSIRIRAGSEADEPALLALFDEAVAWLVARDQPGQWGSVPFSERPEMRERVHRLATSGGLWIAERDGAVAGALAVGQAPGYAPPADRPELYVDLLLSSRRLVGQGIGRRLIELAVGLAQQRRLEQLRVDCWAGAERLVHWYEALGFSRAGVVELGDWHGQLLTLPVDVA